MAVPPDSPGARRSRAKVLVVLHEAGVGGATQAVLHIARPLEQRGWELVFWAPPGPVHDLLRSQGRRVEGEARPMRYRLSALREPPGAVRRLLRTPGYLHRFRRFVARERPALVHANALPTLPELAAAKSVGAPTLLHVHEMMDRSLRSRAAGVAIRTLADGVVGVSEAVRAALAAWGVASRLVYCGLDPPARLPLRGSRPGPLVVGSVGTVSRRKGTDLLVDVARRLKRAGPHDLDFRVIGPLAEGEEGEWGRAVLERGRAVGLEHRVTSDVWTELAELDLCVQPTRAEPFGLALLEAMGAGLPVVAAEVGGVPELVAPGCGVLVPPEDPEALTEAVAVLAADPERRAALGAAARLRALERFSADRSAEALHSCYLSVTGLAPKQPGRLRHRLAEGLDRVRLLRPLVRLRERYLAARTPDAPALAPDGLPMPPARLRVLVDGHADPAGFLEDGLAGARTVRETLAAAGVELAGLGAVLDFGCGCGRVARQWADLDGPEIHGTDLNPESVRWCNENLRFMRARTNGPEPPTTFEDGRFDLIYALSVFTHLTQPVGDRWMSELVRLLRPGGMVLFTTHGESFVHQLSPKEAADFDAGRPVVRRPSMEGANACATYHPHSYVERHLLRDLSILEFTPKARGEVFPQDVYLARR